MVFSIPRATIWGVLESPFPCKLLHFFIIIIIFYIYFPSHPSSKQLNSKGLVDLPILSCIPPLSLAWNKTDTNVGLPFLLHWNSSLHAFGQWRIHSNSIKEILITGLCMFNSHCPIHEWFIYRQPARIGVCFTPIDIYFEPFVLVFQRLIWWVPIGFRILPSYLRLKDHSLLFRLIFILVLDQSLVGLPTVDGFNEIWKVYPL